VFAGLLPGVAKIRRQGGPIMRRAFPKKIGGGRADKIFPDRQTKTKGPHSGGRWGGDDKKSKTRRRGGTKGLCLKNNLPRAGQRGRGGDPAGVQVAGRAGDGVDSKSPPMSGKNQKKRQGWGFLWSQTGPPHHRKIAGGTGTRCTVRAVEGGRGTFQKKKKNGEWAGKFGLALDVLSRDFTGDLHEGGGNDAGDEKKKKRKKKKKNN